MCSLSSVSTNALPLIMYMYTHIYMLLYARKYNKVLAFTLVILVILVILVALVTSAHLP